MSSQSFMWLAFGAAALIVALALAALLIRLRGTLGAVEELLDTTNEELKETLPEVRQTIGNVNDITAGVNIGLLPAGGGAGGACRRSNSAPRCARSGRPLATSTTSRPGSTSACGRQGAARRRLVAASSPRRMAQGWRGRVWFGPY